MKKLSKRELKVLQFMQQGFKNRDIAKELGLNEKTISTYKARMKKKLDIFIGFNDYKVVSMAQDLGVINRKSEL